MTDQDQRTRNTWTPPDPTLEQPDTSWAEPASSTQDSTAPDSVEDGAVYQSAAHESLVDEPVVDEHADPEHGDPEHAVGVASVPDEPALDPEADEEHDDVSVGEMPIVPVAVDDAATPDVAGSGELLPGDVPDGAVLALFDSGTTERFREQWQALQLRFIDDPHTVASQAGALADEVVTALRDAVDRQRTALEDWQSGDGVDTHSGDTERLRVAVRRYRDFLDRLLGL